MIAEQKQRQATKRMKGCIDKILGIQINNVLSLMGLCPRSLLGDSGLAEK